MVLYYVFWLWCPITLFLHLFLMCLFKNGYGWVCACVFCSIFSRGYPIRYIAIASPANMLAYENQSGIGNSSGRYVPTMSVTASTAYVDARIGFPLDAFAAKTPATRFAVLPETMSIMFPVA